MRAETPHPAIIQLVTGHFHERKGYASWRTHGTNDWLLVYTLDGRGRFGYTDGEIIAQPGDMVLIRPGTLHDYGVEPTRHYWELLWTHFHPRPEWHEWLDWPEEAPGLMRLCLEDRDIRERIVAAFFEAHHLATGALRRRETFAMNALETVLLWCDTQNPRSQQSRLDGRVRLAMDYLCRNLAEKITLDTLAERSGLSVSRLAHLFRQQVGMTPLQFLELQRLDRARQLLELTSRSVQAIATELGFDSPFYFTARFKRQTGLSPRAYRQRRREGQASSTGAATRAASASVTSVGTGESGSMAAL
ncbi:MAG TPA: arabinose operon transcriptional regulator AraC [Chthonomonadaceae bacterium]|nr:arabinose operon transcriptional regulator AraC [Chthonomonadaceae bacterium]